MKKKITKSLIDQLRDTAKLTDKRIYVFDTDLIGFGCTATPTGATSYFIEYRHSGRKRRKAIGRHGPLTPHMARNMAQGLLGDVARGIDVAARQVRSSSVNDVFQDYCRHQEKPTKHWQEMKRYILRDAKPIFSRDVTSIERSDIAALIDAVSLRSPSAGRKLFGALRPMFRWAAERGHVKINPCSELRAPPGPKSRDRVLTDEELIQVWRAAEPNWFPFGPIVRLLILTAQRLNEVAGMQRAELDGDVWTIPAHRTKNGREHRIDLHPLASEILKSVPAEHELIFSTTGWTAPSGFGRAKRRIDGALDGVPHWRLHDLRRTGASGMAALGVAPHVIERVLNHVSGVTGGLVSVYQRHEYRSERCEAMKVWGDHIQKLVEN